MLRDSYSVDLYHFGDVCARLENLRVHEPPGYTSLAERGASGCCVCEMLQQADEAVLNFDVGLGS